MNHWAYIKDSILLPGSSLLVCFDPFPGMENIRKGRPIHLFSPNNTVITTHITYIIRTGGGYGYYISGINVKFDMKNWLFMVNTSDEN